MVVIKDLFFQVLYFYNDFKDIILQPFLLFGSTFPFLIDLGFLVLDLIDVFSITLIIILFLKSIIFFLNLFLKKKINYINIETIKRYLL